VVVASRLFMYNYCKRKNLTYVGFAGWVAGEIFFMALVYTILIKTITDDPREFIDIFKKSVEVTALVLILPYLILWLYFALREKNVQLRHLEEFDIPESQSPKMIPFFDEKGTLRLSVKREDVLFLEAADNYVTIHYLDGQKSSRFMIRNSMKTISDSFPGSSLVRCHRSYMVNFDRVKIIRKEKDGLHLELDIPEKTNLPVSKTYVQEVLKKFSTIG
jgi:DNA-binding LytR/AlgR family response regulator